MADWSDITPERKRAIRAEMLRRWKQKLRKKGAAKAAGGNVKAAGGTGSLKGWVTDTGQKLTKNEIKYAQTVRKTQRKKAKADPKYKIPGMKKTRKAVAKTARKTGAGNKKLVTAMSMKEKSKGGTVGYGTHKAVKGKVGGGAKRIAAKAWRTKHMAAAKGTAAQKAAHRAKVQKRFRHMIGK